LNLAAIVQLGLILLARETVPQQRLLPNAATKMEKGGMAAPYFEAGLD